MKFQFLKLRNMNLSGPCCISHYGIYSETPERSRPFPTAYFYCGANIQMICRAECPHPAAEKPCWLLKRELVGVKLRHLALCARPFCRLHTPLGSALLNFIQQTRTCRGTAPPFCLRKNVLSLKHPAGVFVASANANLSGRGPSILLSQDRSVACTPHWGMHCWTSFNKREFDTLYLSRILLKPFCKAWFIENNEFI